MSTELLPLQPWTVVTASSARRGVELAKTEQPHLILVDFQMPELDGPAAVERLKAEPTTRRIPVVATTAMPSTDVDKLLKAGCIGYVPKPFDVPSFPVVVGQFVKATAARFPDLRPR